MKKKNELINVCNMAIMYLQNKWCKIDLKKVNDGDNYE